MYLRRQHKEDALNKSTLHKLKQNSKIYTFLSLHDFFSCNL